MENYTEKRKENAYTFIKNDYLNAYASIADLFKQPHIVEKFKKEGKWPLKLKSFSERYQHMQFNISDSDQDKIKKLDELSLDANRLLSEPEVDLPSFLNLATTAAEICDRPDIVEIFKNRIKE